ncbi:MAG: CMD domain-containing protein [Kiloniellaceae bacterium]
MDAVMDEEDLIARQAGIVPAGPVSAALEGRADILEMTRKAAEASLRPAEPGGISHAERAAIAVRIARLNGDDALAAHYAAMMERADVSGSAAILADPGLDGAGDARLTALTGYIDLVSVAPKNTVAGDIETLKAAGIGDADIVRLAELTAFLAYQVRVIAGLKLMQVTA